MFDPLALRRIFGQYPTGVCVITSRTGDGAPIGMSVGSFSSVSLGPPLVAFFARLSSTTWTQIKANGAFCVNVLADHQEALSRRFGATAVDRFESVAHAGSTLGMPVLDGIAAWIDCTLDGVHSIGDHALAVGRVVALGASEDARPLLFHRGRYGRIAA